MNVLCLIPNQTGYSPGQRGSIELWEKVLEPEGIRLDFAPFETERLRGILYSSGNNFAKAFEMVRGYVNRIGLLRRLDEYDAVFVYREAALLGPAILERLIARRKPIIYQLDDPLFVPYKSPSNGILSHLKFFGKIKEIIRISTVVMVNSTQIRQYAEQFNQHIWQVPSIVDTSKFTFELSSVPPSEVCIGWSGSYSTLANVKLVERPLRAISEANRAKIHLIGGTDFDLSGVKYTAQLWQENSEVEDLRKLHIGLIPLPDHPWNPYKFIMKTAQYMALGIVPVGTPMASNLEAIRHGENGFLAGTDDEWIESLTLLAKDHDLRMRMSVEAAKDAKSLYSLEANRSNIIKAFKAAVPA